MRKDSEHEGRRTARLLATLLIGVICAYAIGVAARVDDTLRDVAPNTAPAIAASALAPLGR